MYGLPTEGGDRYGINGNYNNKTNGASFRSTEPSPVQAEPSLALHVEAVAERAISTISGAVDRAVA